MLISKRVLSGEFKISLLMFMKVSVLRNEKLLQWVWIALILYFNTFKQIKTAIKFNQISLI
jgi:hypothetical protein